MSGCGETFTPRPLRGLGASVSGPLKKLTSVSPKYLQCYLNEFDFRRNHTKECMFDAIMDNIPDGEST